MLEFVIEVYIEVGNKVLRQRVGSHGNCGVLSYVMLCHWSPVIIVIVFPNCVYVRVCKCTCVRVLRCEL